MKSKPSLRKSLFLQITAVLLVSITFVSMASILMDYTEFIHHEHVSQTNVIENRDTVSKTNIFGHIVKHLLLFAFLLLLFVCGNIFVARQLSDHLADTIQPFLALFNTPEGDNVLIEPEEQHYAEFVELALAANEMVKKKNDAEQAYLKSEERYREIVEGTDNLVTEVDIEGNFTFVNETSRQVFGLAPEECIGRRAFEFIHEEDRDDTEAQFKQWVEEKATSVTFENRQVSQSGDIRNMLWTINFHLDANGGISSIKSIAMELNKLKARKLFLYLPFLIELIERIRGLAKVHSLMSRTGWRALEIDKLCREVATATLHGLASTQRVDLQVSTSPMRINSRQAHHLTMVIHELTTNAMKHALKDRQRATIHIEIAQQNGTTLIRFKDDGPGYQNEILQNSYVSSSIGFELIRGITRHSLRGDVFFTNQDGAVATITFKNDFENQKEGVSP